MIRHVGNTALHGAADGDESAVIYLDGSDDTLPQMFFFAINALAEELLTRPRIAEEKFKLLPDGVRDTIARKRERIQKQPDS